MVKQNKVACELCINMETVQPCKLPYKKKFDD